MSDDDKKEIDILKSKGLSDKEIKAVLDSKKKLKRLKKLGCLKYLTNTRARFEIRGFIAEGIAKHINAHPGELLNMLKDVLAELEKSNPDDKIGISIKCNFEIEAYGDKGCLADLVGGEFGIGIVDGEAIETCREI